MIENDVEHLYTTKDVARVRDKLKQDQGNIDPITSLEIPDKQAVLDHCHDSQFVRAVLHRQTNAVLGKIENLWSRYLKWWYNGTLSDFLRGCADYIEKEHPKEYLHPSFIKHLQVQFNKLNEKQKQNVLSYFGEEKGCNATQRKLYFKKFVLKRTHSMKEILEVIQKERDNE
jgi:hypothetical protein